MSAYAGPEVVSSGLVLSLDAGNSRSYPGSGTTWTDLYDNTITGTLTNGPTFNSSNGGAIVFDGANDGVQLAGTNLSLSTMTISSWNFSANYTQSGMIFEKTTNGTVNTQYNFYFNNSDNTLYYGTTGLTPDTFGINRTTAGVVNNQWNNVVATYNGTNKRIYVNGILVATSGNLTGTIPANTTGAAFIGTYGSFGGYFFNGRISITQLYNRALSAAEIRQNFNALRGRYGI